MKGLRKSDSLPWSRLLSAVSTLVDCHSAALADLGFSDRYPVSLSGSTQTLTFGCALSRLSLLIGRDQEQGS